MRIQTQHQASAKPQREASTKNQAALSRRLNRLKTHMTHPLRDASCAKTKPEPVITHPTARYHSTAAGPHQPKRNL